MDDSALAEQRVKNVMELLALPGRSGEERQVLEAIRQKLIDAGLPESSACYDNAHQRAERGETGNLIVTLPGTVTAPRRLFMAHVDTVPLCAGAVPIRGEEWITSESPKTALGGDDRSGAAVLLSTALRVLTEKPDHPPLTFLWAIQEEVGLVGARFVEVASLNNPELSFNFDGGAPEAIIRGATGDSHMDIVIHGKASHAGAYPENGVSATVIAALAIADLQEKGWLGLIQQPDGRGTSNIGRIQGGDATNVVTDYLTLQAEARSHNREFREKIVAQFEASFRDAAQKLTNVSGECGQVDFTARSKYDAFALDESHPVVQAAWQAVEQSGLQPLTRISNGGLDANWMTAHGIPTVTLGCGQEAIHTVAERLHIPSYLKTCGIAWRLATDTSC